MRAGSGRCHDRGERRIDGSEEMILKQSMHHDDDGQEHEVIINNDLFGYECTCRHPSSGIYIAPLRITCKKNKQGERDEAVTSHRRHAAREALVFREAAEETSGESETEN